MASEEAGLDSWGSPKVAQPRPQTLLVITISSFTADFNLKAVRSLSTIGALL
ncbi:MAG: hypothetical protein H7Z16_06885 [Pyrinomonadaceae bacterium]|nr:hypothetical protein [Pyrinomonadaceae bacterium]